MNEISTIHRFRCNLNNGTLEVDLKNPLMHQDALGDIFRASIWRGTSPADLTGVTVRGYLYLAATQQTILLDGSVSGSVASVALTSSCYAVPGHAALVVQLQQDTVRHTILKVNFVIDRTCTDAVIDPGNVLPTLAQLLAQISAMEQATAAANDAAAAAETAREGIQDDLAMCLRAGSVVVNGPTKFVAPYNDMNTLPVGQVVTYIGRAYYPVNLPDDFVSGTSIITVLTLNYDNAKLGGAVQVIYTTDACYWRHATTETAYSSWTKIETAAHFQSYMDEYSKQVIRGHIAVNSTEKLVEPYTDMNTLPVGSVVTYIGSSYYPENLPPRFTSKTGIFTAMTFNYTNKRMGGAVQVIYTPDAAYWRYASTETAYGDWVTLHNAAESLDAQNLMPLFETVGVIGDSYSSGAVSVNGLVADHYAISWGQIMARRNGITCTNFSAGGLTTRTWLTHSRGAALLQSESAKKLYILALGINDNALLKADYLGTAADIKMSDYTKNPDTFYGNYGRIIAMIKEKAPNAKIVISTMAPSAPGNYVAAYNTAISEIAGLMGIPLLVQGDDHYFTSRLYKNNIVNNHPLASGYAHMAAAFERMICKAMNDNQSYFADYVG